MEKNIPKYQLIESYLIDRITSNELSPGDPLPTEAELSKQFSCSRVTVRQALSNLTFDGFIVKKQGSGSYVKVNVNNSKSPEVKSFTEDMIEAGKIPSSRVVSFNVVKAGKQIAEFLQIKPDDLVYYIERTRYGNDEPIMFEKTFMSVDKFPDISVSVFQHSKYQFIKDKGFIIDYSEQTISPVFLMGYIADELNVSPNQPVLRTCNLTYLNDGSVLDYTEFYTNPNKYVLKIIKKSYE